MTSFNGILCLCCGLTRLQWAGAGARGPTGGEDGTGAFRGQRGSAEGESGSVWKMEVIPSANGSVVGWERKRGVKEASVAFGLNNWKH